MLLKEWYVFDNDLKNKEIGIEVEMEGKCLPENVSYWITTRDPSLRGNSFEYVLSQPSTVEAYKAKLDILYDKFKEPGYSIKPSDRCGVHIHLNMRDSTLEQIFNVIILYLIFEDVLIRWCGEEREGNLFCLRAKDAEWFLYKLVQSRKAGWLTPDLMEKEHSKYAALGLHTLQKYGSLEFRSMGTPKNAEPIKKWTDVLLRIKSYAVKEKDPTIFIGQCSQAGPIPFMHQVFGDLYDEFKTPGMTEMIMNGIRKVQGVAYTPLKVVNLENVRPAKKMVYWNPAINPPPPPDAFNWQNIPNWDVPPRLNPIQEDE